VLDVLKLSTDRHEASRVLFATAELLVSILIRVCVVLTRRTVWTRPAVCCYVHLSVADSLMHSLHSVITTSLLLLLLLLLKAMCLQTSLCLVSA